MTVLFVKEGDCFVREGFEVTLAMTALESTRDDNVFL